ncbi:PAS-domain containing protein [Aliiroseovarius sp. KMU-50]|uniref:PAS-domain containing protein n=1 Tax=Aliiroseovarius salicola TaxID=3009082 RepID=A0ABT4VXG4_9RHOB|nr:PAS-domain containing protein [Aliiroseovarius sp. KMU-50]MDA5092937.1 PAS-domain containing protein [Aliiroseovarius sp. KMU-50]
MLNSLMAVALVLTALCVALAALYILSISHQRRQFTLGQMADAERDTAIFLFDDQNLVDATECGWAMLDAVEKQKNKSDWMQLSQVLRSHFYDLDTRISELGENGELDLLAHDGPYRLRAQLRRGLARIEFIDDGPNTSVDTHHLASLKEEAASLRSTTEHLPFPIWREDENRNITWANRRYLDLAESLHPNPEITPWPPHKIFDKPHLAEVTDHDLPRRVALPGGPEGHRKWFELHDLVLGTETLRTALPVDRLVKAENSRAEFISTLGKTFADLSVGLVIFDRKRQLAVFNPALNDLVSLPIEFLVGKPSLFRFLDHLREKRMMPEPKDYKSWRQQMSDLECAAVNGTYEETWSLPSGQTYRVTGHPHPEGAVAFLFEDITAEISLTRRFRAELEMGQSALDCIEDAIAVFAPGGTLAMSNNAYTKLWGCDPESTLLDISISDACMTWRHKSRPTDIWDRIQIAVADHNRREKCSEVFHLLNGRKVTCHIKPMVRGATMVSFSASTDLPASPMRQNHADGNQVAKRLSDRPIETHTTTNSA